MDMKKVIDALRSPKTEQKPGIIQGRQAYTQYAIGVQEQGGTPVSFEQFMQGQR